MLQIPSPCIVIGDIHGQILDLFRILNVFGVPSPKRRYLFLGDLIDRGEFSVECLVCAFLLKALWPDSVYIIRGNHEFAFLCSQCGFMTQIVSFFTDASLFHDACSAFRYLPLAARIDESILCVHGGIGPSVTDIAAIEAIERPIDEFGDDIVDSLVWSDPSEYIENFESSPTRGAGYLFGPSALRPFLERSRLTTLVRAHECMKGGIETHFDGILITVFSASNYCGLIGNQAAVLEVIGGGKQQGRTFAPLPWLTRVDATFEQKGKEQQGSALPRRPSLGLTAPRSPQQPQQQVNLPARKKLSYSASMTNALRLTLP